MTLGQCVFGPQSFAYLETTDASSTKIIEIFIPTGVSATLKISIIGYSGLDYLFYSSLLSLKQDSGFVTSYGIIRDDSCSSGAGSWVIEFQTSEVNNSFKILITGEAAHFIKWSAIVYYELFSEITGA